MKLAEKLLNSADSVLIVTIDEKEYRKFNDRNTIYKYGGDFMLHLLSSDLGI